MGEQKVQDVRKRNELAKEYLNEAYRVQAVDKVNGIGIAFWVLMEQLTLKE